MSERVVVTGVGAVTPLGLDVSSTWQGLIEGRSSARRITRFDPSAHETQFACEVDGFDPGLYLDRKEARRMDRSTHYVFAAARQALADAKLEIDESNADEIGIIVGTGIGGIETLSQQFQVLFERGPSRISPFLCTMMVANMASGHVSIQLGLRGPNFVTISACASSGHALGEAFEIIRRGDAQAMLAGGTEAPIVPISMGTFNAMRALSTRNEAPERASRPFDRDRDGFVLADGAGILILESLEHARGRGARILAEMVGYGATADASHVTAPSEGGTGAAKAMVRALAKAKLQPTDVDYVNAHGTSTPLGDKAESDAIKHVLGDHAYRIPISSTKSMTGHLLGAAGAVEAIISIQTILHGIVPPTINQENPDPECDLDYVPNVARKASVRVVLSNTFGFGGHNASLIFRAWE